MICAACRAQRHDGCDGCTCQHRVPDVLLGVAAPAEGGWSFSVTPEMVASFEAWHARMAAAERDSAEG